MFPSDDWVRQLRHERDDMIRRAIVRGQSADRRRKVDEAVACWLRASEARLG